jgi:hypothetical protein
VPLDVYVFLYEYHPIISSSSFSNPNALASAGVYRTSRTKNKKEKKKTFERLNRKLKWPFLHVVIGIHRHLFLSYLLKALQRPAGLGGPAAVIVRESGHARSPQQQQSPTSRRAERKAKK